MSLIVVNSSVEWNSFNLQIFSHFSLFVSHEIIFRSTINIERALHKPITTNKTQYNKTNNNNQTNKTHSSWKTKTHTKIACCRPYFTPFCEQIFEIIGFGYPESNTENGLNYPSSSQQSQHHNQDQVRNAARNRNPGGAMQPQPGQHMRNQRMMNNQQQQQQQMMNNQGQMMNNQMQPMNPNQVIDHDENLSDKEIYPGSMHQQVITRFSEWGDHPILLMFV